MTPKKDPAAVALGTKGGKSTSEAKKAAARINGQKGGWHRRKQVIAKDN